MKDIHRIFIAITGILALASCSSQLSESEKMFLSITAKDNGSEIALVKNGSVLEGLQYDENFCQLGYNASTRTFKMIRDDGSYYYMVTCEETPKTGKKIRASVKYTTKNDVVTVAGARFHVSDMDPETGVIRLWNESSGIGVSIVELH